MAFNLFDTLSARSRTGKSVLAVVTILVMFMFVLSSGAVGTGNDIFDQLGGVFSSSKKSRGDVVAVAYGDEIRSGELGDVRRQRMAAQQFLFAALAKSYTKWAKTIDEDVRANRVSPETQRDIQHLVSLRAHRDENEKDARAYQAVLSQFMMGRSPDAESFKRAQQRVRLRPESDDKKVLDAFASILAFDMSLMMGQTIPLAVVPGGESDRDTLDFILLLKKADRLGIKFSRDAVNNLVADDTGRRVTPTDQAEIATQIRKNGRMGNFSDDWLNEAIANEYRARLALLAEEGEAIRADAYRLQLAAFTGFLTEDRSAPPPSVPVGVRTVSAMPGAMTPYEFFEFYKDRCSENNFDVLVVSADAMLAQVTEKPTDAELTALFDKYKGELPDPSRDRPGFKDPKKVKLEFTTLDATAPRIAQAVPKVQAASLFLCASAGAIAGNPAAALAEAAQPSVADTLPVREVVSGRVQAATAPYQFVDRFNFQPRDTSIYRPQPIVAALGMLAGHPDVASFTAAAAAVHQHVERFDHQARVPVLLQPVLTGFNPTLGNAIGMPAFALAFAPKGPPEALYLGEATAAFQKDRRRNLFLNDVRQLTVKLEKVGVEDKPKPKGTRPDPKADKEKAEKDRAESAKIVADWLKDRGLTAVGTKAAEDQYQIAKDPELKPLNDNSLPDPDGTNTLSKHLFPEFGGGGPQPFRPFWFPRETLSGEDVDKPSHLVWETEEIESKAYYKFDLADKVTNGEMRKRVEAAWRLEKARGLAKAEADRLAERVREIGKNAKANPQGVERQIKDLAAEKNLREFTLDGLAKLKFEHGLMPQQQEYKPPTIDKAYVLYPTPDFTDKLLDLRTQPVGAVTVLPDAPRTRYYVACLTGRTEKTVEQFAQVFDKTNASTTMGGNQLFSRYALPEERGRATQDVMLRLRADAKLELKEGFKNREKGSTEE